jgi:uncharacterized protein (TIGR02588 family)
MKSHRDSPGNRQGNTAKHASGPRQDKRKPGEEIPRIEWVAGIIGFVLTCATLIFLLYRGISDRPALPDIVVETEQIIEVSRGYVVLIRAMNRGARTAADVKIEAELTSAGKVEETAETTFGYVPSRSERRGGLFFSKDPRHGQLTVRPKGYEAP